MCPDGRESPDVPAGVRMFFVLLCFASVAAEFDLADCSVLNLRNKKKINERLPSLCLLSSSTAWAKLLEDLGP